MIKIGICYDNIHSAIWVEQLLDDIGKRKLIAIDIDIFCSGEDLCKTIKNGTRYDILFIKVEMKSMNGIECANNLRLIDPDVLIIYLSNYENHLVELFEAEPFGFIKAPINPRLFEECFDRAYSKLEKKDIYFEYKFNKSLSKVLMRNILYFESKGRIIHIVLQDKTEKFYGKLSELENQLENSKFSFLRIHQSYLVNYRFIEKIDLTKVRLFNGIEIQISEDRNNMILEQYRRLVNKN